jgi:hypothetical protein
VSLQAIYLTIAAPYILAVAAVLAVLAVCVVIAICGTLAQKIGEAIDSALGRRY